VSGVLDIEAGAVPSHDTPVVDQAWDGPAEEKKLKTPITGPVGKAMYAWYDSTAADPDGEGFPDAKSAWKFPHHVVDSSGQPGAANLRGVRNAMSRLDGSNIPQADKAKVRAHLQKHLDKGKRAEASGSETPGVWLSELDAHLWAMDPRRLAGLYDLAAHGRLETHLTAEVDIEAARQRGRPRSISGGVATVPLKGVLAPVGGLLAMLLDIPNPLDVFRASMREAMADSEVGAIVIDIDSPGGVVDGIPEAAAELYSMRGQKPIVAHANPMAASAAYWLAAQADEIVTTPSGAVGSIGVYATHRELSGAMEMMGVKNTLISAGKYKTEGNPYEPLSDSAREHIQEDVDYFYEQFTAAVAQGRDAKQSEVKSGYGEGRVLNAKAAQAAGLVDRVETLSETIARLTSRSRSTTSATAEADDAGATLEATEAEAGVEQGADEVSADQRQREREKALALLQLG
jgi:signal peptide peptidase SppA